MTPLERLLQLAALPQRTPAEEVELQQLAHAMRTAPIKDVMTVIAHKPYGGGQLVIPRMKEVIRGEE